MPQKTLILAVGRLQGNSEKYGVIFETLTFGIFLKTLSLQLQTEISPEVLGRFWRFTSL